MVVSFSVKKKYTVVTYCTPLRPNFFFFSWAMLRLFDTSAPEASKHKCLRPPFIFFPLENNNNNFFFTPSCSCVYAFLGCVCPLARGPPTQLASAPEPTPSLQKQRQVGARNSWRPLVLMHHPAKSCSPPPISIPKGSKCSKMFLSSFKMMLNQREGKKKKKKRNLYRWNAPHCGSFSFVYIYKIHFYENWQSALGCAL